MSGDEDALIVTETGQMIRFHLQNVKIQGRTTRGVRVIRLAEGDKVLRLALTDHEESTTNDDLIENTEIDTDTIEEIIDDQE